MKVTINDVAKHAGVSIKTVSRVINNESSVRQHTRDKVMASVSELKYHPNLAARNLAGTKAYTIAFIYDNPNAYYVIDMQQGILNECRKQGFELLIHPCNAKSDGIFDEVSNMIRHSRISGIVLTPPFSEMPAFVQQLTDLDVNVVRIISGSKAPDRLSPCIMVDDRTAAYAITQHLISLGHKDIAFILGGKEHQSTAERYTGYKEALNDSNIAINEQFLIDGEYSFESGVEGAQKLLALDKKPSAIFSCNDEIAAGALFAARLAGVTIPDTLSIVGFENSPFSRQTWPKLTTADQPNQQIAKEATSLLIAKARSQMISGICTQFTPKLIVRDSSANPG